MLFKGTNLQPVVNKYQRANAQYSECRNNTTLKIKLAKRVDLNYSNYKKIIT